MKQIPRNVGDLLPQGAKITEVKEIVTVIPVKYNGMLQEYEVCDQRSCQHMAVCIDDTHIILFDKNAKNLYMLIDAI